MSEIFNKENLLLDIDVNSQKEAFEVIANLAKQLKVTNDPAGLVKDLIKREEVSTTGMADEVAIPHAMSADFNKPAIIVARFKKGVEWKAIGGKPVRVAFALLIPEKQRGSLHMKYLQNIALALLKPEFNQIILNCKDEQQIFETINSAVENNQESTSKNINTKSKGLIIGVTACATGIAHTYMAREALEKHAQDVGYDVWIETQGQTGAEHKLTDEMIKKAVCVVIAADINVELDRFAGKKIYVTNTNEAINTPVETLQKSLKSNPVAKIQQNMNNFAAKGKSKFLQHMMSGISRMLPFVVFSGILSGIFSAIVTIVYGTGNSAPAGSVLSIMGIVINTGFTVFISMFGGFMAESIGGRAAFAPAFIASFVASAAIRPDSEGHMHTLYWFWDGMIPEKLNLTIRGDACTIQDISLGIFAAIGMGFAGGHLIKFFNKAKIGYVWRQAWAILFIPVIGTSLLVFPFFFLLSGPLGYVMNGVAWLLAKGGSIMGVNILIGFLLGAMVGFDMGGPINKIAFATAITFIPIDPRLMGAVSAAIPVAPMGVGMASVMFGRKLFDDEDHTNGISALCLSVMGISEGAIPFAGKYPKQTVVANVVGSAIAGGLAFLFFVGSHVPAGGLIVAFVGGIHADSGMVGIHIPDVFGGSNGGWLSYLSNAWYVVAICSGAFIQCFLYIVLMKMYRERFWRTTIKSVKKYISIKDAKLKTIPPIPQKPTPIKK